LPERLLKYLTKIIQNSFDWEVISPYLCNPLLKKGVVLRKKSGQKKCFSKFLKKHLADIKKALTFALPIEKRVAKKAKRSLKVWK